MKIATWFIGAVILCGVVGPAVAQPAAQPPASGQLLQVQITFLERLFEQAVQLGATRLSQQAPGEPYDLLLFGEPPRSRGFILDGYGVFFSVEVPPLRPSILRVLKTFDRPQIAQNNSGNEVFETMRKQIARIRDRAAKRELEQTLDRMQALVGPPEQRATDSAPSDKAVLVAEGARASDSAPAPVTPSSKPALVDPEQIYTREVRDAIVETILDYGTNAMKHLAGDEWLIVAARGSDDQTWAIPPSGVQRITLILRVRGRDLAAMGRGTMTREQVRTAIEVKEY